MPRKIVVPLLKENPCITCKGIGTLGQGVAQITCPTCDGTKITKGVSLSDTIFYALKPKPDEQGLTRDQMRLRTPIIRAAEAADGELILQDDQYRLLLKCIDERGDWPFGLDVDALLTAIEDAERVATHEEWSDAQAGKTVAD